MKQGPGSDMGILDFLRPATYRDPVVGDLVRQGSDSLASSALGMRPSARPSNARCSSTMSRIPGPRKSRDSVVRITYGGMCPWCAC